VKPQIRLFESTLLCVAPHLAGAVSAYFLKGVVPEWDLKDIYIGMMQFMGIQVLGLLMIIFFPQIALWLPGVIYGN
jgi:TRAP-type mannitol/chloroaromatic compound transport system permease large subunit